MFKLRYLEDKDAAGMLEWMHAEETKKIFQKDMSSMTEDKVLSFIRAAGENTVDKGFMHYAVVNEADEYLGTISLKDIDNVNKCAEYAVSFRKCAQGTGAASYATSEILRFAFEELGLHRVYLNVLTTNLRANSFYKKMGFKFEGTSRDSLFLNGKYESLNWYAMIRSEFVSSKEAN